MIDFKRDNGAWAMLLAWSAFVLFVDAQLGIGLVEAVRSEWFDTAPGAVTKSEIKRGRKGSVRFELEYAYTVNGQQRIGTKYHVQPQFVGNRYWFAARDANPVGAPVTVSYDPDEPGTAFLAPGLRSDALFIVWWLAPFNLVMVAMAWAGWRHLRGCRGFDPARRRCVRETRDGWLVRPDPGTRFVPRAFAVLLASTFAGCFVAMLYVIAFDFPPPWWLPLTMWGSAITATATFAYRDSRRWLFHINELEATLTFTYNGNRVTVPRKRLLGIDATTETRKRKGTAHEVTAVALRWRDAFDLEQPTLLAEYANPADAGALTSWLSEHLHLPSAVRI